MKKCNEAPITVMTERRRVGGIEYRYELRKRYDKSVAGYGISLYSFAVAMRMPDDYAETASETKDLFSSQKKAAKFFEKLVSNLATPIDLPYILEDSVKI